ncbi:hypothetical protein HDU97_000508 [Phlyctochytrium planicorne]|nr:hypothetical protein HDU97_000508 [Phlyctochytrium planicorne]
MTMGGQAYMDRGSQDNSVLGKRRQLCEVEVPLRNHFDSEESHDIPASEDSTFTYNRSPSTLSNTEDSGYEEATKPRPRTRRKGKSDAETLDRRVLQNRAAQRAFRLRKERYVKGLEEKVSALMQQLRNYEESNQSSTTPESPSAIQLQGSSPDASRVCELEREVESLRAEAEFLKKSEAGLRETIARLKARQLAYESEEGRRKHPGVGEPPRASPNAHAGWPNDSKAVGGQVGQHLNFTKDAYNNHAAQNLSNPSSAIPRRSPSQIKAENYLHGCPPPFYACYSHLAEARKGDPAYWERSYPPAVEYHAPPPPPIANGDVRDHMFGRVNGPPPPQHYTPYPRPVQTYPHRYHY